MKEEERFEKKSVLLHRHFHPNEMGLNERRTKGLSLISGKKKKVAVPIHFQIGGGSPAQKRRRRETPKNC